MTVATYAFKENLKNSAIDGNLLIEKYMYNNISVISFGYKKVSEGVHYNVSNKELESFAIRLLSEEKPDVIHAGHLMRVFDILKAAKKQSIPYIVTLTDFWAICFRGILVNSRLELCTGPKGGNACINNCPHLQQQIIRGRLGATRDVLTGAKAVFSPTKFLANMYINEIPELDIKVIPLGLKNGKAIHDKKVLGKEDPVTLIYGGTWLPHKGLHILLEAFSKVKNEKITLKIYGTGPDEEYNNLVINSAKNDKRIQIKGVFSENDLEMIFDNADCSVIPSIWWENSPYMMTEALARNVPVIVSDVDGLTEYIKADFNGFTFKVGDPRDLQDVIERIANDPSILNEMRENLTKFALQTVEEEAYAYEKVMRLQ